MRIFALALALVVVLLGGASVSHAQNINCASTVGGGATVTTINGNVTVPNGASCALQIRQHDGKRDGAAGRQPFDHGVSRAVDDRWQRPGQQLRLHAARRQRVGERESANWELHGDDGERLPRPWHRDWR